MKFSARSEPSPESQVKESNPIANESAIETEWVSEQRKQSNIKVKETETETESENEDLSDCESSFNIPSEMDYDDIEKMFELIDSGQITNQRTIEIFNQLRVDTQFMNEQMNTEIIEAVYL